MSDVTQDLDLTLIVIAYNEEDGLRRTVEECVAWLDGSGRGAPILIMDDGSTDRTAAIADELAAADPRVSVFHHPRNVGQFRNIRRGLELARTRWFTIIPGDGQVEVASLDMFLPHVGNYDVIFGFPNNEAVRGRRRVMLSHLWRLYLLALFGISVTYLAGLIIAPVDLVRRVETRSQGFLGWYETMVRLVMSGIDFIQIPFVIRPRTGGRTKAIRPWRNLTDLVRMLFVWVRVKGPGILPPGWEFSRQRALYRAYCSKRQRETPGEGR